MKVSAVAVLMLVAVLACESSAALLRAPQHDSAIIQSERLGGNFAYSSVEGHAYQAINPIVQHVATPVAVSYHATPVQVPVVQQQHIAYQAAPVVQQQHIAYQAAPIAHYAGVSPVLLARK